MRNASQEMVRASSLNTFVSSSQAGVPFRIIGPYGSDSPRLRRASGDSSAPNCVSHLFTRQKAMPAAANVDVVVVVVVVVIAVVGVVVVLANVLL